MRFSDIPEHSLLKKRLVYLTKTNQVPHAQLFWGPIGNANISITLAFISYLHCQNKLEEDSCGNCNSCLKMNTLSHPDIKFTFPIYANKTDADITCTSFLKSWFLFLQNQPYGDISDWCQQIGLENKQLSITKGEIQPITQYTTLKPFESTYKIVLIWLPEYLHATTANALLKIVEDPLPQTIFLLVSTAPDKILDTLRSRLQQVYVPAFTNETIGMLVKRKHTITPERLSEIVEIAEGNLNKAYKIIENPSESLLEQFKIWMRACYIQDFIKIMTQVEKFQEMQKENQKVFLSYTLHMIREAYLVQLKNRKLLKLSKEEQQFAEKLGESLNYDIVNRINNWINRAYYHIDRNLNPKILFLNLSLKIGQMFQDIRE